MVDVVSEIHIARPRDMVAEYASDPDNAPEWYVNIKSSEWKTPKPLSTGTQITFKAQFLGRQLEYTYEITEFLLGRKLVMRTAEGPFPMETTYSWETVEGGDTRMTLRNTGEPSGFALWLAPLLRFIMKREIRKDLTRLKQLLEMRD
jgi:uncharacterized membrane protein